MIGLTLIALLVSGQVGVCKPGVQCKVRSVTATAPSGSPAIVTSVGARYYPGGTTLAGYWTGSGYVATWYGQVSAGSGFTSPQTVGLNAYAVSTAGARIDYGPGLNDWASSDGGVIGFETAIEVRAASALNGAVSLGGSLLQTHGSAAAQNTNAGRVPWLFSDAEGVRIIGVATGSLVALDGGFAGTLQYDTTTNKLTLVEGDTRKTIYTGSGADTREGALCGYWPLAATDGAGHTFATHTSQNGGRAVRLSWVSSAVGAGAGGFSSSVLLPDAGVLCTTGTLACNVALFTPAGADCSAAFLAGDLLSLQYTGNCTAGQNPTGNATFSFAE